MTPLHCAANSGHFDIVKFLTLEKHCNPTFRNSDGATPIHGAAQQGHFDILKFFITDQNCSPNIPGQYGRTPLHYAAANGHLHIVKYLIDEQGCDPSCLDRDKVTPSCCKQRTFRHCEIPYTGKALQSQPTNCFEHHSSPLCSSVWPLTSSSVLC